jgi:type IV secretory pathway VirB10-like protein
MTIFSRLRNLFHQVVRWFRPDDSREPPPPIQPRQEPPAVAPLPSAPPTFEQCPLTRAERRRLERARRETSLSRSCSTAATKRSMFRLTAFAKSCELPREFRRACLRPELRKENGTRPDEKRAAGAGGSKCEIGRCQSPRWLDTSLMIETSTYRSAGLLEGRIGRDV